MWLVVTYFLHTTGELCLSPIGLSTVTKLSPQKWTGFCMGAWFLTIANAHLLAAAVAGLTGSGKTEAGEELTGTAAVMQYSDVFQQVAYVAFGAAKRPSHPRH